MSQIRVGSYVTHSQRPAWGIGKVFGQSAQHVLVGFQNLPQAERLKRFEWRIGLLESANVKSDAMLDSWKVECDSTCHHIPSSASAKKKSDEPLEAEWTFDQAYERFHQKFPAGFKDASYIKSEREWKVAQHRLWVDAIGKGGLRAMAANAPEQAAQLILRVVQTSPKPLLQAKTELGALRDALGPTKTVAPFLNALADLLDAPVVTSGLYTDYLQALTSMPLTKTGDLSKWPTVTVIPFLAQPARHMLMKASMTRKVAKSLGFDLKFLATPRWETYERLLALSDKLFEFLQPHGAKDMIDVQAFMGVIVD